VQTGDADATLPALYALGLPVRAMEVGGGGLEESLIALTSDDNGTTDGAAAAGGTAVARPRQPRSSDSTAASNSPTMERVG
jgi:hypothetical protein